MDTRFPFSFAIYDALVDICRNNVEYFECDGSTVTDKRFLNAFLGIIKQSEIVRQYIIELCGVLHEYDFDEHTSANGYRSLVKATHGCINHTTKLAKHIADNRGHLLFRKMAHVK